MIILHATGVSYDIDSGRTKENRRHKVGWSSYPKVPGDLAASASGLPTLGAVRTRKTMPWARWARWGCRRGESEADDKLPSC